MYTSFDLDIFVRYLDILLVWFFFDRFRYRRIRSNDRRQGTGVRVLGRLRGTVLQLRHANGQTVLGHVVQGQRGVLPLRPVVQTPQTQLQNGRHHRRRKFLRLFPTIFVFFQ